jgi:hypothetical protein
MTETCFACGNVATTREHVPPLCLFPARKDALGAYDHRRNLITVPACQDHNCTKSEDDLYFLWVLSTNALANAVGTQQALTKVLRSHRRRPALGDRILATANEVVLVDDRSGCQREADEVGLDELRFGHVLELIALGVYRHHFGVRWPNGLRVHPEFLGDVNPVPEDIVSARLVVSATASVLFAGEPVYGENPDVFWYQVLRPPVRYECLMRLGFYGGCMANATFK